MRKWRRWEIAFLVLLGLVVAAGILGAIAIRRGFSAREKPSLLETLIARAARNMSIPATAKTAKNPVQPTPEILAEARAHFADHCAICHANNGSGDTEIGKNLYPKTPDMRSHDTQDLTDGQIFYIIHNGIRLTGMPAWGEADAFADVDSWKLVHFIRHLPQLTPEEEQQMQELNPKSPEELREEQREQQFLNEQSTGKHTSKPRQAKSHH